MNAGTLLKLHRDDNVALALRALDAGDVVELDGHSLAVRTPVPAGHKIAIRALARGDRVTKYRQTIGVASAAIEAGEHVHVHNVDMPEHPAGGAPLGTAAPP
ncbi:UxaA family hydrolase, partial [Burkholderia glumae]